MAAIDKELYLMEKIRRDGLESQGLIQAYITFTAKRISEEIKERYLKSYPTVDNFKEEYQQEPLTAESIKKAKAMIENSEAMDRLQEEAMGLVPPKIPLKKRTKFRTTSISEDKNSNLFVEEELYSMASEYSLSEVDYNEYMRLKAKEKKEETERVMKPVKPTKWTKKEEVERQLIF